VTRGTNTFCTFFPSREGECSVEFPPVSRILFGVSNPLSFSSLYSKQNSQPICMQHLYKRCETELTTMLQGTEVPHRDLLEITVIWQTISNRIYHCLFCVTSLQVANGYYSGNFKGKATEKLLLHRYHLEIVLEIQQIMKSQRS
jgi:hypothetical protein